VERNDILDLLTAIPPGQFDVVAAKLAPLAFLHGASAPQATRATDLLRYVEAQGQLDELAAMLVRASIVTVALSDLEHQIAQGSEATTIVLYAAPWSKRSDEQAEIFATMAVELRGRARVLRVERTEKDADALWRLGIKSFPHTVVLTPTGKTSLIGVKDRDEILRVIGGPS
jgi:hypothetical protein